MNDVSSVRQVYLLGYAMVGMVYYGGGGTIRPYLLYLPYHGRGTIPKTAWTLTPLYLKCASLLPQPVTVWYRKLWWYHTSTHTFSDVEYYSNGEIESAKNSEIYKIKGCTLDKMSKNATASSVTHPRR